MADQKLTALTENTTPAGTDLLYIVDDPGGTPAPQKITVDNLLSLAGISIGDTIGGTPANGGVLYADSSDLLKADLWSVGSSSYFAGAVVGKTLGVQGITNSPRLEVLDLSGFGAAPAFALATSTNPFSFYMTDTDTLTTFIGISIDPGTRANSSFTVALLNGTTGTPEFTVNSVGAQFNVPVDMNNTKITELATPTTSTDAATKAYADGIIPSQSGNSGKYLTTDGSVTSWGTVSASPGGSNKDVQYNNSGAFAGDGIFTYEASINEIHLANTGVQGGLLIDAVSKNSYVAVGPQGDYGPAYGTNEPHVAINTVRLIGTGGNSLVIRNHTNTNNVTLFVSAMAAANYVTPSNGITGFYLTENGANNAATITAGPTDQGFFARKARLLAQCETGLIAVDATINTIQAKGQTSQTGDLFSGADASANIVFRVGQDGGAVFNENSTSTGDVRMEGDTDANLFFSDASADSVQIGSATTADSAKFYVSGKISTSGEMEINGDLNHDGTNIGFFGVAPTTRQTELTDELTTVTFTAPGTPDYAIQDLVAATGYGFVTKDEGNTVLSVIANLQTRVNELETKLTAYGLLQDAD